MTHQHDGQGGSYVINESGERVLVERTEEPSQNQRQLEMLPPSETDTNTEPADAGFFSPVAPADHSTTE